jgi:hypothetical protein
VVQILELSTPETDEILDDVFINEVHEVEGEG